ncbi:HAD family hydrolase [Paenibacillus cucumis (ex Kampfer et al. 2016)]|uniref:HAD family hydrolase n=1 Tax=Paenibacillus cucumis (ex Kampfer et al. 2016) TaxID=1776858 RepID=A0ABS7KEC5_9BACL|nr:HAD family hydrolase [Paenibacillus cucumis (ex Kampfer et al. 2016)]MBY0202301.1 HAD family hydrolase [Paenibacillus cucumis (ex Kampfer et al. 2016)]
MDRIKAVIFDLDNTILNRTRTFEGFTQSLINTYFGHMESTEHIKQRIIELDEDGYKEKPRLFDELLEELPWAEHPPHEELMAFYGREYVRNSVLMDEAREVVQHLKGRYLIGLITNGQTQIQYGKIDQLGIREDYDHIIVSEEAGVKKPDPRIFQLALDHFGIEPEQCLYIGDHPLNDIQGAAKAGMNTIWMKVNQPWPEKVETTPLHTIQQLRELKTLL